MKKIRVKRTGQESLSFKGAQVAQSTSKGHPGLLRRSHQLALYKTEAGNWVLSVVYHTEWTSERPWHRADVCRDRDALLDLLTEDYDPCDDINLPPGERFDDMAADIEKAVNDGWGIAVTALLEQVKELDETIE